MSFSIWVDSDSIPTTHKSVILKAAVRLDCAACFVADRKLKDVCSFIEEDTHRLRVEKSDPLKKSAIRMIVVPTSDNSADDYIAENACEGDLCITHDIPLASRLLDKNCIVIDDRGSSYTSDNIKSMLKDRDVNASLREMGVFADLQGKQGLKSLKAFSDNFDRTITKIFKDSK